jgi:hypothetical protein
LSLKYTLLENLVSFFSTFSSNEKNQHGQTKLLGLNGFAMIMSWLSSLQLGGIGGGREED